MKNKLTTSESINLVIETFIKYAKKQLKLKDSKTVVKMRRTRQGNNGYIELTKLKKGSPIDVIINRDLSLRQTLKTIAHELTHARQVIDGDLWHTKNNILWKGKEAVTVVEYKRVMRGISSGSTYDIYRDWAWEVGARANEKKVLDKFLESKELKALQEMDGTIGFISNNI